MGSKEKKKQVVMLVGSLPSGNDITAMTKFDGVVLIASKNNIYAIGENNKVIEVRDTFRRDLPE